MTYGAYVNVAPGKPQTGQVKLRISPGTEEAKFLMGEAKDPLRLLQSGVTLNDYKKQK